jgi:hypothetical protein
MRHKYRYCCIAQDIAGSATEDELPQSTLRVGSLDQEVTTQCVRVLQNRLTGEAAKPRSRAGSEAIKGRRRKALKRERYDASKTVSSSALTQDAEVARLTRELNEARQQQTATSDGSPGYQQ